MTGYNPKMRKGFINAVALPDYQFRRSQPREFRRSSSASGCKQTIRRQIMGVAGLDRAPDEVFSYRFIPPLVRRLTGVCCPMNFAVDQRMGPRARMS